MGGAYVAVADGWAAVQWNPAGLWVGGRREAAVTFGNLPLEGGSWVDSLRAARGLPSDQSAADTLSTLSSSSAGLAGERAFGAYLTSARWGLAFQQIYYTDQVSRLRSGGFEIDSASLRVREYLVAIAQPLAQGRFIIGGNVKLVQAQARLESVPIVAVPEEDLSAAGLMGLARDGSDVPSDTVFAVDAGFLLIPSARFRLGGVVKNLNAPQLDKAPDAIPRLPRQIRVGGMVLLHPQVKLSFDFDLDNDRFFRDGRKRRELGGGLEWAATNLAIRGGLLFDLEAVDNKPLYTFGLGIVGRTVRADLAGSWAPDRDGFGWIGALVGEW